MLGSMEFPLNPDTRSGLDSDCITSAVCSDLLGDVERTCPLLLILEESDTDELKLPERLPDVTDADESSTELSTLLTVVWSLRKLALGLTDKFSMPEDTTMELDWEVRCEKEEASVEESTSVAAEVGVSAVLRECESGVEETVSAGGDRVEAISEFADNASTDVVVNRRLDEGRSEGERDGDRFSSVDDTS